MLNILLTPTTITFKGLDDETAEKIKKDVKLELGNKGYFVKGTPHELFKVLLHLSYTYDMEIM